MEEKYCKGYVPMIDVPGARVLSVQEWIALRNPYYAAPDTPVPTAKKKGAHILRAIIAGGFDQQPQEAQPDSETADQGQTPDQPPIAL